MFKNAKGSIKGRKVGRAPGLDSYDAVPPEQIQSGMYDKAHPSTRERDRITLSSLGVDGAVPFWAACIHSGLLHAASVEVKLYLEMIRATHSAANDVDWQRARAA